MNPTQSQLALLYLKAWSEKDLETIESMFADNIFLADWEGAIAGKQQVIAFNRLLFSRMSHIRLDIQRIAVGQDTTIVEISIYIDNSPPINVVDVIEFNDENKIKQIRAYKR